MNKIKFKKNDEVIVIAGKNKWKVGRITKTDPKNNRVYLQDINTVTKHVKPSQGRDGAIEQKPAPIHASNIALLVKKATKTTPAQYSKVGFKLNKDGQKVRVARKTQKEL